MNLLMCTIDRSAVNGYDHSEDTGVICSGEYIHVHYDSTSVWPSRPITSDMQNMV